MHPPDLASQVALTILCLWCILAFCIFMNPFVTSMILAIYRNGIDLCQEIIITKRIMQEEVTAYKANVR